MSIASPRLHRAQLTSRVHAASGATTPTRVPTGGGAPGPASRTRAVFHERQTDVTDTSHRVRERVVVCVPGRARAAARGSRIEVDVDVASGAIREGRRDFDVLSSLKSVSHSLALMALTHPVAHKGTERRRAH